MNRCGRGSAEGSVGAGKRRKEPTGARCSMSACAQACGEPSTVPSAKQRSAALTCSPVGRTTGGRARCGERRTAYDLDTARRDAALAAVSNSLKARLTKPPPAWRCWMSALLALAHLTRCSGPLKLALLVSCGRREGAAKLRVLGCSVACKQHAATYKVATLVNVLHSPNEYRHHRNQARCAYTNSGRRDTRSVSATPAAVQAVGHCSSNWPPSAQHPKQRCKLPPNHPRAPPFALQLYGSSVAKQNF